MNEILQWIAILLVAILALARDVTRVVRDFKEERKDEE